MPPLRSRPLRKSPSSLERFDKICKPTVVSSVNTMTVALTGPSPAARKMPISTPASDRGRVRSRIELMMKGSFDTFFFWFESANLQKNIVCRCG